MMSQVNEIRKGRNVEYLGISRMIRSLGTGSLWPFIAVYFNVVLQMPLYITGVVFSLYFAAGFLFEPLSGILADFFGRKPSLVISSMLYALSSAALYFTDIFHAGTMFQELAFVTMAIPASIEYPAINALISDSSPETGRTGAYSRFRTIFNIGWIFGPIIGIFFFETDFSLIFLFNIITAMVSLLFILGFVKDVELPVSEQKKGRDDTHHFRLDRLIIVFGSGILLLSIITGQFQTSLPVFSANALRLNPAFYGYVYAINGFTVVMTQPLVTRLVRKFSDIQSLVLGTASYIAGYVLVAFSKSIAGLMFDMFVITMGENLTAPAENSVVSRYSTSDKVGRYMAFKSMMWNMGSMIGPSVGFFLLSGFASNEGLAWLAIGSFGLAAIISFMLFSHGMKRHLKYIRINVKSHDDLAE